MKNSITYKNSLLLGALLGLSMLSSAANAAPLKINCPNVENYQENYHAEDTPFVDIDIDETLKGLPVQKRRQAKQLIEKIEDLLIKMDANQGEDYDQMSRTEEEVMLLEEYLEDLVTSQGKDIVSINLLEKLLPKDRAKAVKIWCEAVELMEKDGVNIEQKFDDIDDILDRAETE